MRVAARWSPGSAAAPPGLAPDVVWQGLRDEWACDGPGSVIGIFLGEREAKQEIGAIELIGGDYHVNTQTATRHSPPPDSATPGPAHSAEARTLERGMVVHVACSFERREPPDPWSGRQPRFEGLASDGPDRFFLLARLPSGEPVRVQLGRVSATELRHFVVVDP